MEETANVYWTLQHAMHSVKETGIWGGHKDKIGCLPSTIKLTNLGQHTDFQSNHRIIYHISFQKSSVVFFFKALWATMEEVINFNLKEEESLEEYSFQTLKY